jgi:hypothetical protein
MAPEPQVGSTEGFQQFLAARGKGLTTPAPAVVTEAQPLATEPAPAVAAVDPVAFEDPETGEHKAEPTRADKRIKRLWQERETEKARASRLEQELADLRAHVTADPVPAAPVPATATAATTDPDALTTAAQARIRPKPDRAAIGTTYATYEDYVEDCAVWGGELAAEKRVLLTEASAAQTRESQQQQTFAQEWVKGKAAYPDFDQVLAKAASVPTSPVIDGVVKATPQLGAHLAYWLATHPTDTARIAGLPRDVQILEMGKVITTVEASIAGKGDPAPLPSKPQSQAPAPIAPSARGAVPTGTLREATTYADFAARRNADLAARRAQR